MRNDVNRVKNDSETHPVLCQMSVHCFVDFVPVKLNHSVKQKVNHVCGVVLVKGVETVL